MIPEVSVRTAPAAMPPPDQDAEGQEIRKWAGILGQAWGILTIGAVTGALLGVLAAALSPPAFEAVSTVLLSQPSDRTAMFTPAGMRAIFTGTTIASGVVAELSLGHPPHSMTSETFRTQALTVEDVPGTYLTRLKVRLRDPETAAKGATAVAERAIEHTARVWRDVIVRERAVLERQLATTREELTKAEQAWLASRLAADQGSARDLRVRVPRAIASDGPDRSSADANGKSLEDRLSASRETGEALASAGRRLERSGAADSADALGRRYAREFELVRLENEVEVRRTVYMDIARRLEEARAEMAATPSPVLLLEAAAVPEHPLPGTGRRTTALGLLAGLVLAACFVVSREWRHSARKDVR